MNGWISQQMSSLLVLILGVLWSLSPLFQGHPTQVQSGYFCYWSVLSLKVHPWTQILIHTRETGTDSSQPSLETLLDSNTKLGAAPCPDHRQRKCWVHPELCTSSHLQTQHCRASPASPAGEGPIKITQCSSLLPAGPPGAKPWHCDHHPGV